jgi:hypothetical protein
VVENHWLLHEEFMNVLQHGWTTPVFVTDRAKLLGAKFKNLRKVLRNWQAHLGNLTKCIENNKK